MIIWIFLHRLRSVSSHQLHTQNKMQFKPLHLLNKSMMMTRLGPKIKHFVKQVLLFDVVLGLDHSLVGRCNLGTSESKLEIPGKFRKVVME